MTDNIQHIDVDSDEFIDAPRALRDHVKRLQQANTEYQQKVQALTGQVTATALSGVLQEFKNPERVKRDLLADNVDPLNSEAVSRWLEVNADDYAKGPATPSSSPAPVADEAEVLAHQQLAAAADASRQPADLSKVETVVAQITPNMTGAEIQQLYKQHGL